MKEKSHHTIKVVQFLLALLVSFSCLASYADESVISRAKNLYAADKSVEAYQLLQLHADEFAGTLEYDYLLGQVAIDVGEPLQAIFALERVLDQQPDFAPARAEIAKAYFIIGENEAAKAEFKQAKKAELPAGSQKLINTYLSEIDARILGGLADTSFYIAAGLGYDSNVNSATSTSQVVVPAGKLALTSLETDSSIGLLQGGSRFSRALKRHLNVYGSVDLTLNEAFDENEFSTQIADGVIGLHFLQGQNQYRVSLSGQVFTLDGNTNRNLLGVNAQWQRTVDAANQIFLFGQYAGLRYPDASRLDVNQSSVGATWLHVFAKGFHPVVYFTGYYGDEAEQTDVADSTYIGREYFGLRAGIRFKTSARLLWSGVLTYQKSEHGGKNEFFGKLREDNYMNVILSADYLVSHGWSLRPEISYSKNDSNIEVYSYDRLRALITARKEF